MTPKFFIYALIVTAVSTWSSWAGMVRSSSASSGGSSWSSHSGGYSGGYSGGGGGHK